MKKITLLRGCPGAGKSTYCRDFPDALIVSPDNYRFQGGKYVYVPGDNTPFEKSVEAVRKALDEKVFLHIIVDSTNITKEQFAPYLLTWRYNDLEIEIITIVPESPMVAFKRGLHGVPYSTVYQMYHDAIMKPPINFEHKFLHWYDHA